MKSGNNSVGIPHWLAVLRNWSIALLTILTLCGILVVPVYRAVFDETLPLEAGKTLDIPLPAGSDPPRPALGLFRWEIRNPNQAKSVKAQLNILVNRKYDEAKKRFPDLYVRADDGSTLDFEVRGDHTLCKLYPDVAGDRGLLGPRGTVGITFVSQSVTWHPLSVCLLVTGKPKRDVMGTLVSSAPTQPGILATLGWVIVIPVVGLILLVAVVWATRRIRIRLREAVAEAEEKGSDKATEDLVRVIAAAPEEYQLQIQQEFLARDLQIRREVPPPSKENFMTEWKALLARLRENRPSDDDQ